MPKPTSGQTRFAFGVLFLVHVLNLTDRYLLPAILPKVRHEFGLSASQAGLLGSAYLVIYALAAVPLGFAADRVMRKKVIAVCVALWSAATFLGGLSRNFWQMFAARAVLGIGEAGYGPSAISLLGDYYPRERRGRVMAYWSTGNLLGAAIGFTLGGIIADLLGWRWVFFLLGLPGFIAAYLVWCIHEPSRGEFDKIAVAKSEQEDSAPTGHRTVRGQAVGRRDVIRTIKELAAIPTYVLVVVALIFSFFAIGAASFWLPTYLVDSFGLTLAKAGSLAGAMLVGSGLTGTLLGGWLADRAQRQRPDGRLLVSGIGLVVATPIVFVALRMHSLAAFVALLLPAGVALSLCTGPIWAIFQDVVAPAKRATAIGISGLCGHLLGDAAAPTVVGLIANTSALRVGLIATIPASLFFAGLACLIATRFVATDMRRVLEAAPPNSATADIRG